MDNITSREQELLTIIADLQAHNATLQKEIARMQKRLAELESKLAKLGKNSSTSSKPPSSDIVKPPKTQKPNSNEKRKPGGQPRHPKHVRQPFKPEEVDKVWDYTLDACPDCGGSLCSSDKAPKVIQQVEIIEKPVRLDEHRGLPYWCENCQKVHYGKLPPEVEKGGLFASRLTAQVAYMKCVCHASFSTIRKYIRDVLAIKVSRSYLRKLIQKVTEALEQPYDELIKQLPSEPWLNVDETGHKDNGVRFWTWCFHAETYTLFKIVDSRSSKVLFDVLGEHFSGVLGCDYFSAYRKYMKDCELESLLVNARRDILLKGMCNVPRTKEAQNLAKRFRLHGEAYFRFITTPGIEPTNNLAAQAIRFVVIDRVITPGTRSKQGRGWCERIWTVLATCSNQAYSAFEFIYNAVKAYFIPEEPIPSLLPTPP